jgi:hypothetical protein
VRAALIAAVIIRPGAYSDIANYIANGRGLTDRLVVRSNDLNNLEQAGVIGGICAGAITRVTPPCYQLKTNFVERWYHIRETSRRDTGVHIE